MRTEIIDRNAEVTSNTPRSDLALDIETQTVPVELCREIEIELGEERSRRRHQEIINGQLRKLNEKALDDLVIVHVCGLPFEYGTICKIVERYPRASRDLDDNLKLRAVFGRSKGSERSDFSASDVTPLENISDLLK